MDVSIFLLEFLILTFNVIWVCQRLFKFYDCFNAIFLLAHRKFGSSSLGRAKMYRFVKVSLRSHITIVWVEDTIVLEN